MTKQPAPRSAAPSNAQRSSARSDDDRPRLNLLVAYPYCTPELLAMFRDHDVRFVVDSGAFTAWKAGKPIALDDYCRFLETIPVKPWRYFMLDVVGEPDATWANYVEMRRRGFEPIPIFTRGESAKHLDRYYETADIVGIGGVVRTPRNRAFVNGIMKQVAGRRVHLLGFSDIDFLKFYRPFMCDSSGWNQSPYGQFRLYMGHGQFAYVKQQTCAQRPVTDAVARRLRYYDIEPAALRRLDGWSGQDYLTRPASLATFRGMVNAARDIEVNLGTRYFFACGNVNDARGLIAAWERMNR